MKIFIKEKVTITGIVSVLAITICRSIQSMIQSYLTALVVVTLVMIVMIGRIRTGLVSMIPNLVPIVIALGLVGALAIPLNILALLVGSIALGLAVDDTIHFIHNFQRYRDIIDDSARAVFLTMDTTGRAMLVTSVVLSLGFFNFCFATLQNVKMFGLLAGVTIILAFVADILVAPALMVLLNPLKINEHGSHP